MVVIYSRSRFDTSVLFTNVRVSRLGLLFGALILFFCGFLLGHWSNPAPIQIIQTIEHPIQPIVKPQPTLKPQQSILHKLKTFNGVPPTVSLPSAPPVSPESLYSQASTLFTASEIPDQPATCYRPPKPLIRYFHPPKTGSGFFNVLFYNLCDGFDQALLLGDDKYVNLGQFVQHFPQEKHCNRTMWRNASHPFYVFDGWGRAGTHEPIRKLHYGRMVGLFRKPSQRLISAYYHGRHLFGGDFKHDIHKLMKMNVSQFVRFDGASSCYVKMLNGKYCGEKYNVNQREVENALNLVESQFLFIGITHYYDASVLLWHAMFGGPVYSFEFVNVRVGRKMKTLKSREYDESVLDGFVDSFDEFVYEIALRKFKENLKKYKIPIDGIPLEFEDEWRDEMAEEPHLRQKNVEFKGHENVKVEFPLWFDSLFRNAQPA